MANAAEEVPGGGDDVGYVIQTTNDGVCRSMKPVVLTVYLQGMT